MASTVSVLRPYQLPLLVVTVPLLLLFFAWLLFRPRGTKRLLSDLKSLRTDYTSAHVEFASIGELESAERLKSIFELAGWRVNFGNVPLESYVHQRFKGTDVSGFNRELVQQVSASLKAFGCPDVAATIRDLQVKQDNPKWPHCNQTVHVRIGHQQ